MFDYKKEFKNLLHLLTYGLFILLFAPLGFVISDSFQTALYSFDLIPMWNAVMVVVATLFALLIDVLIGIAENIFIWSKLFDESLKQANKFKISPISLGIGGGWLAGLT